MSWISGIIKLLTGSLFTSTATSLKTVSTVKDIISTTKEGLDVLSVTDEQRNETIKQTMQAVTEFQTSIAGESTKRSGFRRVIATAVITVFLTLKVGGVLVWQVNPAYSQHIHDVTASLNPLVTTIMVSYFGYYAICNVVKSVKAKKGGA